MDGLNYPFEHYYLRPVSDAEAGELRETAEEVLPLRPDGVSNDDTYASLSIDQAVDRGEHSLAPTIAFLSSSQASGSLEGDDYPDRELVTVEEVEDDEDDYLGLNAKRSGDELSGPLSKLQKTPQPGFASFGSVGVFPPYSQGGHTHGQITSAPLMFLTSPSTQTTSAPSSSSFLLGAASGPSFPIFADRIVEKSYFSGSGSSLRMDSFSPDHVHAINHLAEARVKASSPTAPF